eukprot:221460_1
MDSNIRALIATFALALMIWILVLFPKCFKCIPLLRKLKSKQSINKSKQPFPSKMPEAPIVEYDHQKSRKNINVIWFISILGIVFTLGPVLYFTGEWVYNHLINKQIFGVIFLSKPA